MKNTGFGHLKPMLFTIKTSENVGFGRPMEAECFGPFGVRISLLFIHYHVRGNSRSLSGSLVAINGLE